MTAPSPAGLSPLLDQLDEARAGENPALPWHVDPYDGQRIATSLGGGVCSTYLPGDAALIVAAVNALPELIRLAREREALRQAVTELADELDDEAEEALAKYPTPGLFDAPIVRDIRAGAASSSYITDRLRSILTAALTPGADTAGATA